MLLREPCWIVLSLDRAPGPVPHHLLLLFCRKRVTTGHDQAKDILWQGIQVASARVVKDRGPADSSQYQHYTRVHLSDASRPVSNTCRRPLLAGSTHRGLGERVPSPLRSERQRRLIGDRQPFSPEYSAMQQQLPGNVREQPNTLRASVSFHL